MLFPIGTSIVFGNLVDILRGDTSSSSGPENLSYRKQSHKIFILNAQDPSLTLLYAARTCVYVTLSSA